MSSKPKISEPEKRSKRALFYFLIVLGIVLGLSIILGFPMGGLWLSPWAWVSYALLVFLFLKVCHSGMSKKALKIFCVYFLICFVVVMPTVAVSSIITYQSAAQNLTTPREIDYFRNTLGRPYNYTELYQWENSKLHWNYSANMIFYTDPIQICEYGSARCGGYAILYAALCISQGYQARVAVSVFDDHAWNEVLLNGTWTRVDASPTGAPMSENIGYPLFYEEKWGTPPVLALAFEGSSIVDVTSNYRSDHWSLLSGATLIFVFLGISFAGCIFLIWKSLYRQLRVLFPNLKFMTQTGSVTSTVVVFLY